MGRSDGCRRQLRRDDSQRLQIRLGQAGGQHAAPDAAPHPLDREALCAPADARSRSTPLYLLDRGTHGRPHGGCARGGRGAQHAARGLRRAETCGASGPHLFDARRVDPADRRACAQSGRGRRRLHRALLRDDGQSRRGARITFPAAIVSAEECNGIEERIGDAAFEGRSLVVSAGKFAPRPTACGWPSRPSGRRSRSTTRP